MSDIQRYYAAGVDRTENGPFVKYDDHVAAVAAARAEFVRMENAWRDEVDRRQRALQVAENFAYERGVKAGYTARQDAVAVVDILRDALAAIDAINTEGTVR